MTPIVIAIEGVDGTGKTGVVEALKRTYAGRKVVFSREPSDTGYRELIKQCINQQDEILSALLFAADHRHHIENVIKPAIKGNNLVITDRYIHSHLAYQATTLEPLLKDASKWLCNIYSKEWIFKPAIVIHLTAAPKTCEARIRHSRNQIDNYEHAEFLELVEQNYQKFYHYPEYETRVWQISTENRTLKEIYPEIENLVSSLVE